jgi:hypothetical protein
MNIKVGDKVKFLNETGGGIVSKIIDSRMVSVAVEGGFEIPTLASELIRIDADEPGARFFSESFNVEAQEESNEPGTEETDRQSDLPYSVTRNRKSEDIWLAFVPHDQKWLITGLLDLYLVNNTSWDILYNFLRKTEDDKFEGIDYGSVFPDSRLLLATIEREDLVKWTEGYLQFLFHRNTSGELMPPFNSEVTIKGSRFYNEGSYKESPLIEGKGIVVKIVSVTAFLESRKEPDKNAKRPPASSRSPEKREPELIFRFQTTPREAEVDLHIHELVDDPANLEKSEILEFQKNYFIRCLESAIGSHFLKVTFIHGVGNGILRDVILDILKNYKGIEVFDAPMQKYGVGAVVVEIPHNL